VNLDELIDHISGLRFPTKDAVETVQWLKWCRDYAMPALEAMSLSGRSAIRARCTNVLNERPKGKSDV
jgi:hypothetical protein